MLLIGLTGGIGSGKTTVCQKFHSLYDCPIIDADEINRQLLDSDEHIHQQIVTQFGPQALSADGHINRSYLRQSIFSNEKKRAQLEAILHPRILETIKQQTRCIDAPYVLIVIPLLFELHLQDQFDRILVIDSDETTQMMRVSERDNCDQQAVRQIMHKQIDRQTRLSHADDIIFNHDTVDALDQQIDHLHKKYMELSASSFHNN